MFKSLFSCLLVLGLSVAMSAPALAEPTLQQVYQAAESGRLNEAQKMMDEVLKAHPSSGKAHYVEAELLSRQGQIQGARSELATAEQLAPGLPFAKPDSVQRLKAALGEGQVMRPVMQTQAPVAYMQPQQRQSSFPWGILIVIVGVIAFMIWAARFMARRNQPQVIMQGPAGSYPAANGPYGAPGPVPYGSGPVMGGGGGLGGGILGGLATGAAVGAGMVAGEALMHRVMGGGENERVTQQPTGWDNGMTNVSYPNNGDMGGNDFGVSEAGGWDDNSGGGGFDGGGSSDWT